MNRLLSISAALAMAVSASAFANSHKEAPMLTNVAASAPMTAQQSKMGDCSKQAKGKKGDEYKAAMKSCLSAGGAASAPATPMTQQQKMKKCSAEGKGKKGDEYKAYMKTCLAA
jgi:hypothetical protein